MTAAPGSRCLAAAVLLGACTRAPEVVAPRAQQPATDVAGYDLGAPVRSFVLPHKLREISAVVAIDATTVACLQDEKGTLFLFDLRRGEVAERLPFGPKGDYEGLAFTGAEFWVLRSDGALLQLARRDDRFEIARTVQVGAPQREFEGLAWDAANARLVVAPKAVARSVGGKEGRPLYAVDPVSGATDATPYAELDRDRVLAAAVARGIAVPVEVDRHGRSRPEFHLHFSEVAIAPRSGRLWLLSGIDRAVLVVERSGALIGLHFFTAAELPQPEGATFLPDGRLVIASEGAGGDAVLRVYAPAAAVPSGR